MLFDAPLAEPAPTRRSSRTSATPIQASSETSGASRAELRRRGGEQAAQPSTPELAATAVAAAAASIPVAAVTPAPVVDASGSGMSPQLGRRARRSSQTAALPDAVLTPAEPFVLLEPVVDAEAIVEAEPIVESEPFVLLEPVAETMPESEPVEPIADAPFTASGIDEFEAAARLFSFTGETPIQTTADPATADTAPADQAGESGLETRPARRRARSINGAAFRRVTAASFSVGVMGIVGLLTVGMTTPAEAVAAASGADMPVTVMAPAETGTDLAVDPDEIQAYVAPASVEDVTLDRTETYETVSMAQIAAESGIKHFSNFFVNDPNSPIQWPFAVGVPISYGFGMRSGTMHQGADFTPGEGSPIQAIADGTVRVATNAGGGYGAHVIIDHVIDGQLVSSHYAHMLYGSIQVQPGQQVTVGTVLGRTGNTGHSFGAHTHFEILMNGTTPIDPIPWLRQHAGG